MEDAEATEKARQKAKEEAKEVGCPFRLPSHSKTGGEPVPLFPHF